MANEHQAVLWGDQVGSAWAENASTYDEMLESIGLATMDRLDPRPGDHVLDVGCGTGVTTVELARRVTRDRASGSALGIDLSAPMLTAARARAAESEVDGVSFVLDDAQTAELGAGRFDGAFSRMGVMFFADPTAAFANVARALRAGGHLGFCCFQDASANPVVVLAVLAAAEILDVTPPAPEDPGPFSLADADRTTEILATAGFVDVEVTPGPTQISVSAAPGLDVIADKMLLQNPLTSAPFATADAPTRRAALDAMVAALEPYRHDDTLVIGSGTWIIAARTPN